MLRTAALSHVMIRNGIDWWLPLIWRHVTGAKPPVFWGSACRCLFKDVRGLGVQMNQSVVKPCKDKYYIMLDRCRINKCSKHFEPVVLTHSYGVCVCVCVHPSFLFWYAVRLRLRVYCVFMRVWHRGRLAFLLHSPYPVKEVFAVKGKTYLHPDSVAREDLQCSERRSGGQGCKSNLDVTLKEYWVNYLKMRKKKKKVRGELDLNSSQKKKESHFHEFIIKGNIMACWPQCQ